jgi:hypothetical protein
MDIAAALIMYKRFISNLCQGHDEILDNFKILKFDDKQYQNRNDKYFKTLGYSLKNDSINHFEFIDILKTINLTEQSTQNKNDTYRLIKLELEPILYHVKTLNQISVPEINLKAYLAYLNDILDKSLVIDKKADKTLPKIALNSLEFTLKELASIYNKRDISKTKNKIYQSVSEPKYYQFIDGLYQKLSNLTLIECQKYEWNRMTNGEELTNSIQWNGTIGLLKLVLSHLFIEYKNDNAYNMARYFGIDIKQIRNNRPSKKDKTIFEVLLF